MYVLPENMTMFTANVSCPSYEPPISQPSRLHNSGHHWIDHRAQGKLFGVANWVYTKSKPVIKSLPIIYTKKFFFQVLIYIAEIDIYWFSQEFYQSFLDFGDISYSSHSIRRSHFVIYYSVKLTFLVFLPKSSKG